MQSYTVDETTVLVDKAVIQMKYIVFLSISVLVLQVLGVVKPNFQRRLNRFKLRPDKMVFGVENGRNIVPFWATPHAPHMTDGLCQTESYIEPRLC